MIHVLYAEDDRAVANFMRDYFEANAPECSLEIVRTGSECLERMRQGGVDVVLLDLILPDIDGLHILGELAIRGDDTPAVMVSGNGQTELAVKALRAGAVDCVEKGSHQFLEIIGIVRRLHALRMAGPSMAPHAWDSGKTHRIILIEESAALRIDIGTCFSRSSPQLELRAFSSAADLDSVAAGADAVLIGPEPGADPLELLRRIRSRDANVPVILLLQESDGEAAVAAFKLGAQDYILKETDYLADLVFSLNHVLRRADLTRRNAHLSRELEEINRSLEAQVEARTKDLRALSTRLIRVREDERRHVARELHDDIGQLLTGLKLLLDGAAAQAVTPVKGKLDEAIVVAGDLLARTRDLTLRLRPLILDDLGLQPAIEWHLNLFQRQTGVAVESEFSLPPGRLPSELETTIFRIVQEALTNVARHSGSKAAQLTMVSGDRDVVVEIADRGDGFDLDVIRSKRDSVGLAGLSERAQLAGGNLEIVSHPGRGTRIHATFPLLSAIGAS